MNEVRTRRMSSERQFGNQAELGFVPTDKSIVEIELDLIDFSEITENDFPVNICDLSGGKGDQLHWTNEYLLNRGIKSNVFFNELSEVRYEECVERYPYMNTMNTDIFSLKVGSKNNRNFNRNVFSVIRNNPPYMYIERHGSSVRAEVEFFLKNSSLDITGAIHILEIPIHQLRGIKNFLQMICYRYEIFVAKFPKEAYERFKQVAIICKRKETSSTDKDIVNEIYQKIDLNEIPYLDEVKEKVFKVTKDDFRKAKEINLFRENKITEETLFNGLNAVIDSLIEADKKKNSKIKNDSELKPLIELLPGHISQLLASGRFDKIMGNLLIRGGSNKLIETKVIKEEGKETTIETEVLKPFLEITNKQGDILYKNF